MSFQEKLEYLISRIGAEATLRNMVDVAYEDGQLSVLEKLLDEVISAN